MAMQGSTVQDLLGTRFFRYIINRKNKSKGGREKKAMPTTVVRVPWDIGTDLEDLIFKYKTKIYESPTSPRNAALKSFLAELEEILGD